MDNPDTRERLRTAGPFVLDGLLAVAMAAVGFALLASALRFDPGSPLAWAAYLLWQGGVEDLVVGLLGRPGLARWLPEGAAAALTAPGDTTLAMWAGALVLAACGLALAAVGGRLVVSRDLT